MNKGKLEVLCGISGSGKSTYAHEKWEENPLTTAVINRDKIRELLFGYTEQTVSKYYSRPDISKLEKQVTHYEDTLIYEALQQDKTVIVDATHLNKAYLQRFEFFNVPIEYKYFDITLGGAIGRDANRNRSVGDKIISKQYNQYLELQRQGIPVKFEPVIINNNINNPKCVVFDIDGCLANNKGTRSPFDWKRVGEDEPIDSVVSAFNDLNSNNEWQLFIPLYICSGRDEVCREETEKWLNNHLYNAIERKDAVLLMRAQNDVRPDWIVKQEMVKEITKSHFINYWYDDRIQVTRHLRSLGIKVFNVEYNNF